MFQHLKIGPALCEYSVRLSPVTATPTAVLLCIIVRY